MALFLGDYEESLSVVLSKLDTFLGLKVNWGKSQILPFLKVPSLTLRAPAGCPLQCVNKVKYLGLPISVYIRLYPPQMLIQYYIPLNTVCKPGVTWHFL